jgi:hypothetical protein
MNEELLDLLGRLLVESEFNENNDYIVKKEIFNKLAEFLLKHQLRDINLDIERI